MERSRENKAKRGRHVAAGGPTLADIAGRYALGRYGAAGLDEAELGHFGRDRMLPACTKRKDKRGKKLVTAGPIWRRWHQWFKDRPRGGRGRGITDRIQYPLRNLGRCRRDAGDPRAAHAILIVDL